MSLWFAAYRCGCTDVQATRDLLPDRCPGHGAWRIGVDRISDGYDTGHECTGEQVCA